MRYFAAYLLTASVLLAQEGSDNGGQPPAVADDPAGVELLKKVEEKVTGAKAVTLTLTLEVSGSEGKGNFKVEVCGKEGNKMRVDMQGTFGDRPASMLLLSDGKTTKMSGARGEGQFPAAEGAEARFRAAVMKYGLMPTMEAMSAPGGADRLAAFKIGEVKVAGEEVVGEKKVKLVTYVAGVPGSPMRFEHKVWIDEEGLVMVKREVKDMRGTVMTEEHVPAVVDKDIPDSKFEGK